MFPAGFARSTVDWSSPIAILAIKWHSPAMADGTTDKLANALCQSIATRRWSSNPPAKQAGAKPRLTPFPNRALPPYLREVCVILAAGLVRLHRHIAQEVADDPAQVGRQANISLRLETDKSGHAVPNPRRDA